MESHAAEEVSRYPHGRVPRAVRERHVLALAEELFVERGFEGASMDELARRAGVSKPVVYDLVGSKEALFRRCFDLASDELAGSVAAAADEHSGDLRALLHATALAFFRFIAGHRLAWAMLSWLDEGGRAPAYVARIRARQVDYAAALIADRVASAGTSPDAARVEATAVALNGAMEAVAHWWREHPDVPVEDLADWVVDLTLPGLARLVGEPV